MRRYLPTFSELVDRLSILQLKEVFIEISKDEYAKEIKDIEHDIQMLLEDRDITAEDIRAIIVLSQMNTHIWYNEKAVRDATGGGDLHLTHSLNGIRNDAKNKMSGQERKDYKIDCLAADFKQWEVSW